MFFTRTCFRDVHVCMHVGISVWKNTGVIKEQQKYNTIVLLTCDKCLEPSENLAAIMVK